MKRKIYFIALIWVFSVLSVALTLSLTLENGYSEPLNDTDKIINLAKDSDLILIGVVSDISIKKGVLGTNAGELYYSDFQYVTVVPEKIIHGQPKISPIIISRYVPDVRSSQINFEKGEKTLLFLKWFESDIHGKYYYFREEPKRKFIMTEGDIFFNGRLNISVTIDEIETVISNL